MVDFSIAMLDYRRVNVFGEEKKDPENLRLFGKTTCWVKVRPTFPPSFSLLQLYSTHLTKAPTKIRLSTKVKHFFKKKWNLGNNHQNIPSLKKLPVTPWFLASDIFDLQNVQCWYLGHHLCQYTWLRGGTKDISHAFGVVLDVALPVK